MEKIRKATTDDHQAIIDIYNQAVEDGLRTADTEFVTLDSSRKWLEGHLDDLHPIFVCTIGGQLAGWVSISAYRPGRRALRFTKEVSSYVHRDYRGRGIGSKLLEHTIDYSRKKGIKNIFAILLETNTPSIRVLEKFGFARWGHLPRVAVFNGKEVGQYYYGKRIAD